MHLDTDTYVHVPRYNIFVSVEDWLVVGLRRGSIYRKNRQGERRPNPGSFRAKTGLADKIRWYWYPRYVIGRSY